MFHMHVFCFIFWEAPPPIPLAKHETPPQLCLNELMEGTHGGGNKLSSTSGATSISFSAGSSSGAASFSSGSSGAASSSSGSSGAASSSSFVVSSSTFWMFRTSSSVKAPSSFFWWAMKRAVLELDLLALAMSSPLPPLAHLLLVLPL